MVRVFPYCIEADKFLWLQFTSGSVWYVCSHRDLTDLNLKFIFSFIKMEMTRYCSIEIYYKGLNWVTHTWFNCGIQRIRKYVLSEIRLLLIKKIEGSLRLQIIEQRNYHSLLPMFTRIGIPNNYISNFGRSKM
jgi:hypothetical protein